MKLRFDIKKARENSFTRPEKIYGKGITFLERKVINLSSLIIRDEKTLISCQPRVNETESDQTHLIDSFKSGIDYNRRPMVVKHRKDGKYVLISGYNRHDVLTKYFGCEFWFADAVEFDSIQDEEVYKLSLNATSDHIGTGRPNLNKDYINGLRRCYNARAIDIRDKKAIRALLRKMSNNSLSDKKLNNIIRDFYKEDGIEEIEGLRTFTAERGAEILEELGEPASGFVKDIDSPCFGQVGFLRWSGDFTPKIKDILNQYVSHCQQSGTKVKIFGFIDSPKSEKGVLRARESFMTRFEKSQQWCRDYLKKEYHDMVVFSGFIAQRIGPDMVNKGNPKETGLVDQFGNPFKPFSNNVFDIFSEKNKVS